MWGDVKSICFLAGLPLVLGTHQLIESLVWWQLRGDVPFGIGRVATWLYLIIALVVVPVIVLLSVMLLRADLSSATHHLLPFVVLGAAGPISLSHNAPLAQSRSDLGSYHLCVQHWSSLWDSGRRLLYVLARLWIALTVWLP